MSAVLSAINIGGFLAVISPDSLELFGNEVRYEYG